MPGAPRASGKNTRIAYKILGVPANMQSKKKPAQKKREKRLLFEDTTRVR
jgi:hypothetical protein